MFEENENKNFYEISDSNALQMTDKSLNMIRNSLIPIKDG